MYIGTFVDAADRSLVARSSSVFPYDGALRRLAK